MGRIYWDLGSEVYGLDVTNEQFAPVLKEIKEAGAMTLAIRKMTVPAGARTVVMDRFPTLRMVTTGKLSWGTLPAGSDTSAEPAKMVEAVRSDEFGWIRWQQDVSVVLQNNTSSAADFVEWSVAPNPQNGNSTGQ